MDLVQVEVDLPHITRRSERIKSICASDFRTKIVKEGQYEAKNTRQTARNSLATSQSTSSISSSTLLPTILPGKVTNRRRTITVPSNESRTQETLTIEKQLRKLLQETKETCSILLTENRCLQKKNLQLTADLNKAENRIQCLSKQNEKLQTAANTYAAINIRTEHNYT